MEQDYDSIKEKFFVWKKHANDVLSDCQEIVGEPLTIKQNIENLESILASTEKVKSWLDEMESKFKEQLMSKSDNISKHRNEFNGILREVNHALKQMNDYGDFINTLDTERVDLQAWLDDMSKRAQTSSSIESAQAAQQQLDKFLALQKQFDAKSSAFSNIQQQAYEVGDGDLATIPGRKIQLMIQQHASLQKKISDQIHHFENLIVQNKAYQQSRSELRKWMAAIRESNDKLQVEVQAAGVTEQAQLAFNQAEKLWVEKQEGEVKVHATLGRGDRISNLISSDGRLLLEEEMTTLRTAFDELLDELKSVRSQAELKLSELQSIDKCHSEIEAMLKDISAVLDEETQLSNDFKEKKQAVDKINDLLADINEVDEKLIEMNSRCLETGYDTLSSSNNESTLKFALAPKFEPLANGIDEKRQEIVDRLAKVTEIKDNHEKWIISGNELEEWIQSAKEELARWSDGPMTDICQLKKKTAKIEELKAAKQTGRARLGVTLDLAAKVQESTNTNGRELIKAEMQQQKNAWTEWESLLDQTADSINQTITNLEQYHEGYNTERGNLQQLLDSFNEKLSETAELGDENTSAEVISQVESLLKKLDPTATEIRTGLNNLCRRFSNEKSDDISRDVTNSLNNYSALMQKLVLTKSKVEEALGAKFKSKSAEFEAHLRKYHSQIQKYSCPRGGLETAEASLADINRILDTSLDQGNKMLSELNDIVESSGTLDQMNRYSTRQLKEKWKNFVAEATEAKTSMESYIEGLKEFDRNCSELSDWMTELERRLKAESGLRATLGLKKSQLTNLRTIEEEASDEQYKFARLKRRTNRVQYPDGTTRVGNLNLAYQSLCNQSQQASKEAANRFQQHQTFSNDVNNSEAWIKERQAQLDKLVEIANVDRVELEKRLVAVRRIAAERQGGENIFHLAMGRANAVYSGTSQQGIHAVELQVKSLEELWASFVNSMRHTEERITLGLTQWSTWSSAVSAAETWLSKAEQLTKFDDSDSDYSDSGSPVIALHKLQSLVNDCAGHGKVLCIDQIEKHQKQLNSVFSAQEKALESQSAILDRFLEVQSRAEVALREVTHRADAEQVKVELINDFNDWVSEQKLNFAALSEPDGSLQAMELNILELKSMLETAIPFGDEKSAKFDENVTEEWRQLKTDIESQLEEIGKNHENLADFIEKLDNFDAWLKSKNAVINSDGIFKIDLLENGKESVWQKGPTEIRTRDLLITSEAL